MKTKWSLAFLTVLALTLTACHDYFDYDNLAFVGAWESNKYYIEIYDDGYGYYDKRNRPGVECEVRIKDRKIVFDWHGGRKAFCIDAPPSVEINTGEVFMILDGRTFYRL